MMLLFSKFEFSILTLSQYETSYGEWIPHFIILLLISSGIAQMRLRKNTRNRNQKQRSERKKISLPILINTPITHEISVNTFDISATGAFFEYADLKNSMSFTSLIGKRTGIKIGDVIDLKIFISRFKLLNCQAKVVRYNFSENSSAPQGIGIEFIKLTARKKKILEDLIYSDYKEKSS